MAAYLICFFIRLKDTRNLVGYKVEVEKLLINSGIILFMAIVFAKIGKEQDYEN